jgi:hypothetical protein
MTIPTVPARLKTGVWLLLAAAVLTGATLSLVASSWWHLLASAGIAMPFILLLTLTSRK